MPRVRSNVVRLKRKKQVMKAARGAFGARSKLWKAAKENVERGWKYAYRDRKNKKRDFVASVMRINAAAPPARHELQRVHQRPQARGIELGSEESRRSRRARARGVYALAEKRRSALSSAASTRT